MKRSIFAGLAVIVAILLPCSTLRAEQPTEGPSVPAAVGERFGLAEKWLHENNLSFTTSPEQAFVDDYIMVAG